MGMEDIKGEIWEQLPQFPTVKGWEVQRKTAPLAFKTNSRDRKNSKQNLGVVLVKCVGLGIDRVTRRGRRGPRTTLPPAVFARGPSPGALPLHDQLEKLSQVTWGCSAVGEG